MQLLFQLQKSQYKRVGKDELLFAARELYVHIFLIRANPCYRAVYKLFMRNDIAEISTLGLAILNCYMNGMVQSEVCVELDIGRGKINSRKASIRRRYYSLYGVL